MNKILQKYLRFLAKIYLKRTKPKIIAITGSIGKTSTKEAIFEVLKIKFGNNILKSSGNLNNETGVPLSILGVQKSPTKFYHWLPVAIITKWRAFFGRKYEILILELAADKPGDIKYLTEFVKPDVACITAIGPAHLAAFGTLENIVQEKTDLLRALKPDGWAVLNYDDGNLSKTTFNYSGPIITYGIEKQANIMAKNIITEINNYKAQTMFQILGEDFKFQGSVPTLGKIWNVYSALAAVAVAKIFNLNSGQIKEGLANIKTEKHRMEVKVGKRGSVIIDDCYNANPLSMKAALEVLDFLPKHSQGRKIAVLGDMLEINPISDQAHESIGKKAREVADILLTVGNEAQKYKGNIHVITALEAADYLLKEVRSNDIILIKASRKIGLEEVVELLEEES